MLFDMIQQSSPTIKTLRIIAIKKTYNTEYLFKKITCTYCPKCENIATILVKIRNLADMLSTFIII